MLDVSVLDAFDADVEVDVDAAVDDENSRLIEERLKRDTATPM